MDLSRFRYGVDFNAGTYTGTALDAVVNVSQPYQHPAVVPNLNITGSTTTAANQITAHAGYTASGGSTWALLDTAIFYTSQTNDAFSFTTTAEIVVITFTGIQSSGEGLHAGVTGDNSHRFRNGALAQVQIDGVPQLNADLNNATPSHSIRLDGASHTITVKHLGTTTSPSTSPIYLGVLSIVEETGTGGTGGSYTSPVIDSGASDTQWVLAEWAENTPMAAFVFRTGQTPTPGPSWSTLTITPTDVTLTSGARMGFAGLAAAMRARYCQWTLVFVPSSSLAPYFRDVLLYSWVPARDPHFLRKIAMADEWLPGPVMTAIIGPIAAAQALTRQNALDVIAGYSIGGATDSVLAQLGAGINLPQYSGEPPTAYRTRIQSAFSFRNQAGSATFIARLVGQLVGGSTPVLVSTVSSGLQTVTASSAPLTTGSVTVAQTGSRGYTVTIPAPVANAYPGLAGVPATLIRSGVTSHPAQAIISDLITRINPIGAVASVVFV